MKKLILALSVAAMTGCAAAGYTAGTALVLDGYEELRERYCDGGLLSACVTEMFTGRKEAIEEEADE